MRTVLFISLTVMLSMSGIVFAVAEGSPLAGLSLLIALGTLFFVDLEEKFSVPVAAANLLGLIAFIIAGAEFLQDQVESRLLAGGHLIVYLTWVNMVQKKGSRQIWWLFALSVLQMATASVLTEHIWFGGALVLYSFVTTWTLSVFLLYRTTIGFEEQDQTNDTSPESKIVVGDSWKGVSRDVDHRLLNSRFVAVSGVVTCLSLMITIAFFLLTPRVWIGNYSLFGDEAVSGRALTGFTEEVRLGDMSEIMENSEPVLELRLYDLERDRPFTAEEAADYLGAYPLFRGTVMEVYDNGRWLQQKRELPRARAYEDAKVRQDYELSPIGSPVLFGFGDVVSASGRRVYREDETNEFTRRIQEGDIDDSFEYSVWANRGLPDESAEIIRATRWHPTKIFAFDPQLLPPDISRRIRATPDFLSYVDRLKFLPDGLSRVEELAQSIVDSAASHEAKIQALFDYFQTEEFSYSLDLSVTDASIDPLEDFLFNRRSGHCEYYASAMAIMLRAVGIPSRMVSGFKGGTFSDDGLVFHVKQLHAHSWVEAYVEGRWITVDPTPPDRNISVESLEKSFLGIADLWIAMKSKWTSGVRLSQAQQRRLIYLPMMEIGKTSWQNAKGLFTGNTEKLRGIVIFFSSPEKWFSATGGIVAFILLLLLSGIVWVVKRLLRWFGTFRAQREEERKRKIRVKFYERFIKLLADAGIHQRPTQTAREFIRDSRSKLNDVFDDAGMKAWPDEFVETFYSIRFGAHAISDQQTKLIDDQLKQMETSLQQREKTDL